MTTTLPGDGSEAINPPDSDPPDCAGAFDLPDRVREYIVSHRLLEDGAEVLLGVSGGVDSMTLSHVLQFIGYGVRVVHVNYGLRVREADADAALIRSYCRNEGIPLSEIDARNEMSAKVPQSSVQARARTVRYKHLSRIAAAEDIRYVAVAHHMEDQAETIVMNLQRKTGLDGMGGMRPSRPIETGSCICLVRPFLCLRRREIEQYAMRNQIPWREDSSNASLDFLRGTPPRE